MQACLNGTGLCTGHSTVVDGITPHKSPLFKRGRNVVTEVILPHFRVRPFCVVVSSSPWNRRSRVRISEPELTRHSALQLLDVTQLRSRSLSGYSSRRHPCRKRDDKIFIAGEQTRATSYCPTLCPDTARRIQCNVT